MDAHDSKWQISPKDHGDFWPVGAGTSPTSAVACRAVTSPAATFESAVAYVSKIRTFLQDRTRSLGLSAANRKTLRLAGRCGCNVVIEDRSQPS